MKHLIQGRNNETKLGVERSFRSNRNEVLADEDRIVKKSGSCSRVKISDCAVRRLLFANDLMLLNSTQNGLRQAFDKICMHAVSRNESRYDKNKNHVAVHPTKAKSSAISMLEE